MDVPSGEQRVGSDASRSVAMRAREVPAPAVTRFLRVVDPPRMAWSTEPTTVVAGGSAATLSAGGAARFDVLRDRIDDLLGAIPVPDGLPRAARPRVFGGVAFHEDHDAGTAGPWAGFPSAWFVLPAVQLTTGEAGTWLTTFATGEAAQRQAVDRLAEWAERLQTLTGDEPAPEPPGVETERPTPSKPDWDEQVRAAVESINAGRLRKVVLAQALAVDLAGPLDVPATLDRLADTHPECYRFLFQPPDAGAFFGATPERLVEVDGRRVRTAALAGSIGRGETPDEDAWLADELRASEKDAQEHQLVVEAIRDQLAPYADHVRTGDRTVRTLATVQHLHTPITATLSTDDHVLSLVDALHPTPAVGGLPPDEALKTIREAETFDRGWYAAPIGWVDAAGDGTFAVGIRSAVAAGQRATLFAGDGIVADSDPDREWDELRPKFRPILDELE